MPNLPQFIVVPLLLCHSLIPLCPQPDRQRILGLPKPHDAFRTRCSTTFRYVSCAARRRYPVRRTPQFLGRPSTSPEAQQSRYQAASGFFAGQKPFPVSISSSNGAQACPVLARKPSPPRFPSSSLEFLIRFSFQRRRRRRRCDAAARNASSCTSTGRSEEFERTLARCKRSFCGLATRYGAFFQLCTGRKCLWGNLPAKRFAVRAEWNRTRFRKRLFHWLRFPMENREKFKIPRCNFMSPSTTDCFIEVFHQKALATFPYGCQNHRQGPIEVEREGGGHRGRIVYAHAEECRTQCAIPSRLHVDVSHTLLPPEQLDTKLRTAVPLETSWVMFVVAGPTTTRPNTTVRCPERQTLRRAMARMRRNPPNS